MFPDREEPRYSATAHPLPCLWLPVPLPTKGGAGAHHLEKYVHYEGAEVMLSLGQCTEGTHNVIFCVFQQLGMQVCGGGEERECQGSHDMDTMIGPLTALLAQPSNHILTGDLYLLHIPAVPEECHTLLLGYTEETWVVVWPA